MPHDPLSGSWFIQSRSPSRRSFAAGLGRLLDDGLIVVCLIVSAILTARGWSSQYTLALLVAIISFTSLGSMAGLYRWWHGGRIVHGCWRVIIVWLGTVFVLLSAAYLSKTTAAFSRLAITVWLVVTPLTLCGWRFMALWIFSRLAHRRAYERKVVVWGRGETADRLVAAIRNCPHLGLTLIDHIVTSERDRDRRRADSTAAGSDTTPAGLQDAIFEDLVRRGQHGDFNVLYIARQGFSSERLGNFIDRLSDTMVSVYLAPDFSTIDLFQGHWSSIEGIPLISVFDTPFLGVDGDLKRIEDIVCATLIIALIAVPMLVIALLIKLTSPGPILFAQRRYGIGGKPITVLKFRSMTVTEDGPVVVQATRNDSRITPLGGFLRKTSLDELPQFFNVLRGEMSIVGPRPHAVAHNEFYRNRVKGYMLRHKVKPGITGWAQINGWRGETDDIYKMEKRVEYDFWYIRNWSLWLDIKIILLTVVRGFKGKNAY